MKLRMTAKKFAALVGSAVLVATLAACGNGYGIAPADAQKNAAKSSQAGADNNQASNTSKDTNQGAALAISQNANLGAIVVDAEGRTLYRFDKDLANPPKSNCAGGCATIWPPVIAGEGEIKLANGNPALLGTVDRSDGSKQVTLGGWPLYRYAEDEKAGDVKGQGVGGIWFASAPDGKKAAKSAQAASPPKQANSTETQSKTSRPNWQGAPKFVAAVQNPELGNIVVDDHGRTLYRFDNDTAKPSVSNCLGDCAKKWPPVKFTDKLNLRDSENVRQRGIDQSLVGNIMRKDGVCQLTIAGWPMYRFAKDVSPGDINGQGVGGTWFVSTPEGKKALGASAGDSGGDTTGDDSTDDDSSSDSGYGY